LLGYLKTNEFEYFFFFLLNFRFFFKIMKFRLYGGDGG